MKSAEIRRCPAFPCPGEQEQGHAPTLSFTWLTLLGMDRGCQVLVGRGTSLPAPGASLHPGNSSESRKLVFLN